MPSYSLANWDGSLSSPLSQSQQLSSSTTPTDPAATSSSATSGVVSPYQAASAATTTPSSSKTRFTEKGAEKHNGMGKDHFGSQSHASRSTVFGTGLSTMDGPSLLNASLAGNFVIGPSTTSGNGVLSSLARTAVVTFTSTPSPSRPQSVVNKETLTQTTTSPASILDGDRFPIDSHSAEPMNTVRDNLRPEIAKGGITSNGIPNVYIDLETFSADGEGEDDIDAMVVDEILGQTEPSPISPPPEDIAYPAAQPLAASLPKQPSHYTTQVSPYPISPMDNRGTPNHSTGQTRSNVPTTPTPSRTTILQLSPLSALSSNGPISSLFTPSPERIQAQPPQHQSTHPPSTSSPSRLFAPSPGPSQPNHKPPLFLASPTPSPSEKLSYVAVPKLPKGIKKSDYVATPRPPARHPPAPDSPSLSQKDPQPPKTNPQLKPKRRPAEVQSRPERGQAHQSLSEALAASMRHNARISMNANTSPNARTGDQPKIGPPRRKPGSKPKPKLVPAVDGAGSVSAPAPTPMAPPEKIIEASTSAGRASVAPSLVVSPSNGPETLGINSVPGSTPASVPVVGLGPTSAKVEVETSAVPSGSGSVSMSGSGVGSGSMAGTGVGTKRKYTRRVKDSDGDEDDDYGVKRKTKKPRVDGGGGAKGDKKNANKNDVRENGRAGPYTLYDPLEDVLRIYFGSVVEGESYVALVLNTRFLGGRRDLKLDLERVGDGMAVIGKGKGKCKKSWFVWPPVKEKEAMEGDGDQEVFVGSTVRGWDEVRDGTKVEDSSANEMFASVMGPEKEVKKVKKQRAKDTSAVEGAKGKRKVKEKEQLQVGAVGPINVTDAGSRPRPRPGFFQQRSESPLFVPETDLEDEMDDPEEEVPSSGEAGVERNALEYPPARPSAKALGKQRAMECSPSLTASRPSVPAQSSSPSDDVSMEVDPVGMEYFFGMSPQTPPTVVPVTQSPVAGSRSAPPATSQELNGLGDEADPGSNQQPEFGEAGPATTASSTSPPKPADGYAEPGIFINDESSFFNTNGDASYGEDMANSWTLEGVDNGEAMLGFGNGTIDPSLLGGFGSTEVEVTQQPSPSSSRSASPPSRRVVTWHKHVRVDGDAGSSSAGPSFTRVSTSIELPAQRAQRPRFKRVPRDMVTTDDLDLSSSSLVDPDSGSESDSDDDSDDSYESKDSAEPSKALPPPPPPPTGKSSSHSRQATAEPEPPANVVVQESTALALPLPGPGRVNWPKGATNVFCHQCRTTSLRLNMTCACKRHYCVRCITLRYDGAIPFDVSNQNFVCPACNNSCTCDVCTKKRGEVYISLRAPKKVAPRESSPRVKSVRSAVALDAPRRTRTQLGGKTNLPLPTRTITGPVTYWATIYGMSGEKVGTAFVGSDGNDDVVVARPVGADKTKSRAQKRHRVFVGSVQPSWELGPNPKLKDLKPSKAIKSKGKGKAPDQSTVRWYVGKKALLFARSAPPVPPATVAVQDQEEPPSSSPNVDALTPLPSEYEWPGEGGGGAGEYSQWLSFDESDLDGQGQYAPPVEYTKGIDSPISLGEDDVGRAIQLGLGELGVMAYYVRD